MLQNGSDVVALAWGFASCNEGTYTMFSTAFLSNADATLEHDDVSLIQVPLIQALHDDCQSSSAIAIQSIAQLHAQAKDVQKSGGEAVEETVSLFEKGHL